jgi:hypothetical protein
MAVSKYNRTISNYISALSDVDFLRFAHRFLNKIFPVEYPKSLQLTANGYTLINNNLYSVIPTLASVQPSIRIISSLNNKPFSSLVVLAKTAADETIELQKQIKKKIKKVTPEIWDTNQIIEKVRNFSEKECLDLLDNTSTFSSYFKNSCDQIIAFDTYQEIFSDIVKNFIGPYNSIPVEKDKIEFTHILEKVPLNFSVAQVGIWDMYSESYQFKTLAEKFIQEQFKSDDEFKQLLISEIRSSFRTIANAPRHNYPVNEIQVIEKMAQKCLRPEFKEDPKLIKVARGIVLYLFELCEFGARNINDQKSCQQPSLFDGQPEN